MSPEKPICSDTERLFLRPTTIEDADFLLELMNTPKWKEYIGDRQINNTKDAQEYINKKILPQQKRLGFSNYTLIKRKNKVKIGVCGLYDRKGLEGVDIGFALLPEFEGNGYITEAAVKMLSLAFETFTLEKVQAITSKENLASQKVLEKIGLQRLGTTVLPEEKEELLLYGISLNEYRNRKK